MDGMVDLDKWTDGGKAQQEQSDDLRCVGVCGAEVKRQRYTSTTPTSFSGRSWGANASYRLPLCFGGCLQSVQGPPYQKYPTSHFRVPHLIGPGRVEIENFLDSHRGSSQIICPRAHLSLINPYICMSPVIIHIWSQCHLLTLCFALSVRGNKCFVGQQKQPADGFSEWCWHTDNAQQLQAYKIILKIASYYASEHIKMSIFSLWHLK